MGQAGLQCLMWCPTCVQCVSGACPMRVRCVVRGGEMRMPALSTPHTQALRTWPLTLHTSSPSQCTGWETEALQHLMKLSQGSCRDSGHAVLL